MKVDKLLGVAKKCRYLVPTILFMIGSAYSLIRWFTAGLIASKWIGLPEYAFAMREMEQQSRRWGIAALILEGIALILSLVVPGHPAVRPTTANAPLTFPFEQNRWKYFVQLRLVRAGLCIFGTIGLVLVWMIAVYIIATLSLPKSSLPR